MTIREIGNGNAIAFLREHQANREVVFIRPQHVWFGAYEDGELIGVCGLTRKHGRTELGGMLVDKAHRGGFAYAQLYFHRSAYLRKYGMDDKIVSYSRPGTSDCEAHDGFVCKQVFRNGTKKMVKERGS